MTSKHSLPDLQNRTPPGGVATANVVRQRIEGLIAERLAGRRIDGVGFVDELLAIASMVGEVSCCPAADRGLRFAVADSAPFEVELDGNRGKLRMLCARLAVLCQENGCAFMVYGGEGTIRRAIENDLAHPRSWRARWTNTMHEQAFTITAQ